MRPLGPEVRFFRGLEALAPELFALLPGADFFRNLLGTGLNAGHVDRFGRRVQRPGHRHLRPGECSALFLIIELIGGLGCGIEQGVLAAHVYTAIGAVLRAFALLLHNLMAAQRGALAVNDFALVSLRALGKNAQRCQ